MPSAKHKSTMKGHYGLINFFIAQHHFILRCAFSPTAVRTYTCHGLTFFSPYFLVVFSWARWGTLASTKNGMCWTTENKKNLPAYYSDRQDSTCTKSSGGGGKHQLKIQHLESIEWLTKAKKTQNSKESNQGSQSLPDKREARCFVSQPPCCTIGVRSLLNLTNMLAISSMLYVSCFKVAESVESVEELLDGAMTILKTIHSNAQLNFFLSMWGEQGAHLLSVLLSSDDGSWITSIEQVLSK